MECESVDSRVINLYQGLKDIGLQDMANKILSLHSKNVVDTLLLFPSPDNQYRLDLFSDDDEISQNRRNHLEHLYNKDIKHYESVIHQYFQQ